jgi:hypothetical protein
MACRAWRPVAQKLIHSRVKIRDWEIESLICGYRLNSLVFGSSSFQISTLSLELLAIGKEFIPMIVQIVAPTISTLSLDFCGSDIDGYETLTNFFSRCQWIRNLRLEDGQFGDGVDMITPTIKEGFSRLNQLDLINWYCGNLRLFIESTPIPNLKSFLFVLFDNDSDVDIIDAAVMNYGRSLINLNLSGCYVSSGNLVKIKECCRALEKLTLSKTEDTLSESDIKIIASLPHLKYLEFGDCDIAFRAVSALARCKSLNHLSIDWEDDLIDVLRVIGRNLASLVLREYVEEYDEIVKYCPNLQYLDLMVDEKDVLSVDMVKQELKEGLKRLAKLKVNGSSVRLGTDWEGY